MNGTQPEREPLGGSLNPPPLEPAEATPPAAPPLTSDTPSVDAYQPPPAFPSPGPGSAFPAAPVKPHRATLLLILAVSGFLCCAPLSIGAFVLGSLDLKEMNAGRMDPSGRTATNVARYLGLLLFGAALATGAQVARQRWLTPPP